MNFLREKIKEVDAKSKELMSDKNHPYHKEGGMIKFIVICLYIGIVGCIIGSLVFAWNYFTLKGQKISLTFAEQMGLFGKNLLLVAVLLSIYCVVLAFLLYKFLKKIKNKDTNFLLLYHKICIFSIIINTIVVSFNNFYISIDDVVSLIIGYIVATLYFCLSVRVRVYFGGDEFLRKDYFIRFLLDEKS